MLIVINRAHNKLGTDKYEKKTFGNYGSTLYRSIVKAMIDCGKEQWRIILDSCK